jgi:hypothetical protein
MFYFRKKVELNAVLGSRYIEIPIHRRELEGGNMKRGYGICLFAIGALALAILRGYSRYSSRWSGLGAFDFLLPPMISMAHYNMEGRA